MVSNCWRFLILSLRIRRWCLLFLLVAAAAHDGASAFDDGNAGTGIDYRNAHIMSHACRSGKVYFQFYIEI